MDRVRGACPKHRRIEQAFYVGTIDNGEAAAGQKQHLNQHVNKVDLVSQGAEMSAIPLAIILDGIALLSFSNSSSISMALSPILTQVGISA